MPLVNIYFSDSSNIDKFQKIIPDIKTFLAKRLSGENITLSTAEISVRFMTVTIGEMIAPIEIEITAHAFPERIKQQDEISLEAMKLVKDLTGTDVKVWLKLMELGHSWD